MKAPDDNAAVFGLLDTKNLTACLLELSKIIHNELPTQPVQPEALPLLNFECGRRSVLRDIEVELERRKGDASVL